MSTKRVQFSFIFALTTFLTGTNAHAADDIDGDPIRYDTAPANNIVSRLERRLGNDSPLVQATDSKSFLRALLKELSVPESSQVLVFSRTSLQRQKIMPERPRAIFSTMMFTSDRARIATSSS